MLTTYVMASRSRNRYNRTSINGREETRLTPVYRLITLSVAHIACEPCQNVQTNLPLIDFLPLKAAPLIEVRLYLDDWSPFSRTLLLGLPR
jgi:hypothetical protein